MKVGGDPLDDIMDSARYGLYSWVTAAEKPREMVLREALAPLAEIGDMTSANIRTQMIMAESQHANQPARLGRYRTRER